MSNPGWHEPPSGPQQQPGSAWSSQQLPTPPGARPHGTPPRAEDTGKAKPRVWLSALIAALVAVAVAIPTTLLVAGDGEPAETTATEEAEPDADEPAVDRDVTEDTGDAGDPSAMPVADVADAVSPSVARIDVESGPQGEGSGSAVAYRDDGYLITNAHVVMGTDQADVTLPDGSRTPAEVVGADEMTDIAVLRIAEGDLPEGGIPVPEFASEPPRVGETAVAIGSPFGLDGTVTSGVVSAVGRAIPGLPIADAIQTDAPINPGNTAILGSNPMAPGNLGIGFAIPIATAASIADQLIDQGYVEHALLGIQGQDVDPAVAEAYGLGATEGALVVDVAPESGAAEAGLEQGDIVTSYEGEPVASMAELAGRVRTSQPGDEVDLTVIRGGEEREVTITLGSSEDPDSEFGDEPEPFDPNDPGQDLQPEDLQPEDIPPDVWEQLPAEFRDQFGGGQPNG